ncbi:helix-turn-helix domain-containing protein [Bacillus mycoides]
MDNFVYFVLQTRQNGFIISIRKQRRYLQQLMDEIKNGELEEALFSVYTTREAEKMWGLAENTVNKWCNRGKFYENEARKSGKVWLVTRNGMNRLTRK